MLDCGSQSSFITHDLCVQLGLETTSANISVVGIANIESSIQSKCSVKICSLRSNFQSEITCFVLQAITSISPMSSLDTSSLNIPANVKLADTDFLKAGKIDILLGSDVFWVLLGDQRISCGKHLPLLQDTKLGWVLAGMVGDASASESNAACFLSSTQLDLQKTISKFWEVGENGMGGLKPLSKEEIQ